MMINEETMLCLNKSCTAGVELGNTHCTDKGQVQDGAKDWYSPDKAYNHWKEAPGCD